MLEDENKERFNEEEEDVNAQVNFFTEIYEEYDGKVTKEVSDKPKHEEALKSYKNPGSSKKAPEVCKTEIIADDPFYPAFMLAFDKENKKKQTQIEISADISNNKGVSPNNKSNHHLYLSLSENQGVLASEATLVTSEDNAKSMTGTDLQESLINSDTSDQLLKIRDDDNGKENIVSEEKLQRGERTAKKKKSDGMTGVKLVSEKSLSENQGVLASEATLATSEDNTQTMTGSDLQEYLINSDTSAQLSKIRHDDNGKENIVSEKKLQREERTAKKKSDIDESGLTGLKLVKNCEAEQVQINDEPNMELAKKVCSADLTYVRNIWQSEIEGAYCQENVVYEDDKKTKDAPTTANKKGDIPIHVEGTKIKSQPVLLGALEEENDLFGLQKQMLQEKPSSSEDTLTDNSDSAHNGKYQYSVWSRFKIYLTDKLGSSILAENRSGKVKGGKSDDGKSSSNREEIPTQELGLGANYDNTFFPKSIGNESKRNEVCDRLLSIINSCKSAASNKQLTIGGAAGLVILSALVYKRIRKN
ncbi:hypothetical protein QYM36_013326 [Artemia franciscana]|uniref:Uncharacterized protein n=1 Tax=Artemia franciscana TaxID=6661 RepID=A0AA88L176_ARTSF|nr:hypothetical protein QYM36_013326 [Artemia franciscana]